MAAPAQGPQAHQEGMLGSETALAYLRASREKQQRNSRSLDQQLAHVKAYCQTRGYDLDPDHIYREVISGKRTDRSGFHDLLSAVQDGHGTVIVSYDVKRFGRNREDHAAIMTAAGRQGLRIETATRGRDYLETPEDELQYDVEAIVSRYNNKVRVRDSMRGKQNAAENGYWPVSRPPLGYEARGPNGSKTLHRTEYAWVVEEIYARYRRGDSLRTIAEWSRDHEDSQSVTGWPRWHSSVCQMLSRPVYAGWIPWQGILYEGRHEAIIPRDAWETVQQMRGMRRAYYRPDLEARN